MRLLRKIAFPISLVYALVVHIRNYLYDVGFLKSRSFDIPIICIGNLSVGGTGKTPMIELLASHFQHSHRTAVLSRGYKRKSKGFLVGRAESTVEELGDEPFQIHSKFPQVVVAVDANRTRGILELKKRANPDVILLDDAFQHRKVRPGYTILLTTYSNLYTDDWYLPTGDLRDAKKEARRANAIVVTKCPSSLPQIEKDVIISKIKPIKNQQIFFSSLAYDFPIGDAKAISWEDLGNLKITLVTGIAYPEPLILWLKNQGLVFEHLRFGDHHYFTKNELALFKSKECILTTEKDYVRLTGKLKNLYYVPVHHHFLNNEQDILAKELSNFMMQGS
ncbi:tetraacyldisaccharide 4'-kinase [Ulvibacterium marinum]|uniref:tetraacyldisaccharide 4'-kinase n=1 Tax=Ulvibacterium marinum TaxID=2419782 RepID=UPI002495731F|nr:tetraacyldisaccharide 4'-kinase [Ulvibacterium marinum]